MGFNLVAKKRIEGIYKICILLSLTFFSSSIVFAQQDTTKNRGVIFKINPLESFIGTTDGEIGAYIQIPITKVNAIQVGAGSNTTWDGKGYSIRLGFYQYFSTKNYISIQLMYRRWKLYNVYFYSPVGSPDSAKSDIDNSNAEDEIINPKSEISNPNDNGHGIPCYTIDNVIVNVYALDVVWGRQLPLFRSKHFIFEEYIGFGLRVKSASLQQLSYQWDHVEYPSTKTLSYLLYAPDVKLGFMIGYKF